MSQHGLATQYRDSSNLSARQRIYRFATSPIPFGQFVMERRAGAFVIRTETGMFRASC
jgi:hypothetical protein